MMSPSCPSSPSGYDGEDAILVFKGRNTSLIRQLDLSILSEDDEEAQADDKQPPITRNDLSPECIPHPDNLDTACDLVDGSTDDDDGQGLVSDYLDNILANGESLTLSAFHLRDLGASDDELCFDSKQKVSDSERSSTETVSASLPAGEHDISRGKRTGSRGRSQGKNSKKIRDMSSDGPVAMSGDQIIENLRIFLISSDQQLTFPPLSKPTRKLIHEVAGRLRLKSKSLGRAETRRPVLYRTKATPRFEPALFQRSIAGVRNRLHASGGGKGIRSKQHKGESTSAGCREGEVSSSKLPELTADNRGRAMLEKMGWTTGMGLGAHHNKGILEPVPHVVKRSKAGLGKT